MNLDDLERFQPLDRSRMLDQISVLAGQLEHAFALGKDLPVPAFGEVRQILAVGCGAILAGADCLSAYAEPVLPVLMKTWRTV